MGWTYLVESEGSPSPWLPGCGQSPIVNTIKTSEECSCLEWEPATLTLPPSGTTCELCGRDTSLPISTLFPADSPARTLAVRALALAWEESDPVYSSRSSDSLMKWDQNRHSFTLKTSQLSLFEASTELPPNLPDWGIWDAGALYPLRMSALITNGAESGSPAFIPTPTASDADCGAIIGKEDTFRQTSTGSIRHHYANGKDRSLTLGRMVQFFPTPTTDTSSRKRRYAQGGMPLSLAAQTYPTPTASMQTMEDLNQARFGGNRGTRPSYSEAKETFATPMARDYRHGGLPSSARGREGSPPLSEQIGGKLNPRWVEWLMGFPSEWTCYEPWAIPYYPGKGGKASK